MVVLNDTPACFADIVQFFAFFGSTSAPDARSIMSTFWPFSFSPVGQTVAFSFLEDLQ
jgi:hypothetical protein